MDDRDIPLLNLPKFKIYYDDGSIYSSENTHIDDLPRFGVIIILQERKNPDRKPQIVHGNDFFYLNTIEECISHWRAIDWSGILDRLLNRLPVEYLLQGRMVSSDRFTNTITLAQSDSIYTDFFKGYK